MTWPEANIELAERDLRTLLTTQCPDIGDLELTRETEGFDNVLWRLGDDFVVRLPRRKEAVTFLENEIRWLPQLAARVTLPISCPVRIGLASATFPWPWVVTNWYAGTPGDRIGPVASLESAHDFGSFLRSLHQGAPDEAPRNPWRSVELAQRAVTFEERMVSLEGLVDASSVRRVWRQALEAPVFAGPPVWLHGDLHPANVIVASGALRAVVDFGDLCAGDPATDLAGAWMLFPPELVPAVWDAYGDVDESLIRRSIGWAALFGVMFVNLGRQGRTSYGDVGRRTLENIVRYES
ncbi:MAG: aminoglycoside phosphotransferase family protein [Acidimicrobiales bacterium]